MVTLKGVNITLRALEPEDLEFVYKLENDERVWEVSNTQTPYSKFLIKQYLENAHLDIYPAFRRAGIGILILDKQQRGKGFGKEALELVMKYGKTHLHLHQLYASINEDNKISQDLFVKTDFKFIGQRKDWTIVNGKFKNENLYQHIYVY